MYAVTTSMTDPNNRPVVSETRHADPLAVALWIETLLNNGATGVVTIERVHG